ncbi:UNVERIFIED_CONTAM: hypothetical protein HDU68_007238 [Siphonaria sp. JEL0065]|nr:hypothetical protein HDU68_007238 [Siphonaria sp. JEL0065]
MTTYPQLYVTIQQLIAAQAWEQLETQLSEAEAGLFPGAALPNHPLVLRGQGQGNAGGDQRDQAIVAEQGQGQGQGTDDDVQVDAGIVGFDGRVYGVLLAVLLIRNDLVGARLLVRRTPRHVFALAEFAVFAKVAEQLYTNNTGAALRLLADAKNLPVLRASIVAVAPSSACVIVLVNSNNTTPQQDQQQPQALSRLAASILIPLINAIEQRFLRLVAVSFTNINLIQFGNTLFWSQDRILTSVQDGSLAAAMRVESVSLDNNNTLKIVQGAAFKNAISGGGADSQNATFGPGLQQVKDLADYLVHLEREI